MCKIFLYDEGKTKVVDYKALRRKNRNYSNTAKIVNKQKHEI